MPQSSGSSPGRPVILLTRPQQAAERFARLLRSRGVEADIEISPLFKIEPVAAVLPETPPEALIFTSENGVSASVGLGVSTGLPAFCVGDRTAKAARAAGFVAQSAGGTSHDLVALVLADPPQGSLWHLRGEEAAGDVSGQLRRHELDCLDIVVYRQKPLALTDQAAALLGGDRHVIVPVFSPRSALRLVEQSKIGRWTARTTVLALSQAVADAAGALAPSTGAVAAAPTADALATLILAHTDGDNSPGRAS